MLQIVLTPKILGPSEIGALGLSLFGVMVNPRLLWRPCTNMFFLLEC